MTVVNRVVERVQQQQVTYGITTQHSNPVGEKKRSLQIADPITPVGVIHSVCVVQVRCGIFRKQIHHRAQLASRSIRDAFLARDVFTSELAS
jgi:hypothetical protein